MGNPLFGVDIAGIIKDNIGPGVLDAVLTKFTPGTRTPGQLTGGTNPTNVTFACKGFIDRQGKTNVRGSLADTNTVVIVLIGDTINGGAAASAPKSDDHVTLEGITYVVLFVDRDPAAATYTLQAKPI
jgi:hypothetical protein